MCDYRLSKLIGPEATTTAVGIPTVTAASGAAFNALGFYIIVHSTSGLTMIGSTLAGASAAGTIGIIGGTGGAVGAIAAIVSAPLTIAAASLAALGVAISEGACYFADERITEYDQVLGLLKQIAVSAEPDKLRLYDLPEKGAYLLIDYRGRGLERFDVANLYVVNGELMNRDWGLNTSIGYIGVGVAPKDK